uniref:Pleckstrin homology domain containing, family F (with FYVE domain) member 2 n=1 Tax=Eptatretus burgeri TaxID=7764 RepID=A0A8C4QMC3_EPTBU
MVDRLVNSEGNSRRIAAVESCFGAAGQPLAAPGRVLVGEGTLTKQCRKGPKPRQFFLFNDLLVYGAVVLSRRRYAGQRIIPLEQVSIRAVPDEGDLHNGWLIQTPAKSFKVFAATALERTEWMSHIERCVRDQLDRKRRDKSTVDEPAAVWVPDASASTCMRCHRTRFTALNRRHHCRKCGFVVCAACSEHRHLIPQQSSRPLRVCQPCYEDLSANSHNSSHNTSRRGSDGPVPCPGGLDSSDEDSSDSGEEIGSSLPGYTTDFYS